MKHDLFVVAYLLVMVTLIIGLDVLFLRDQVWWRLGINIGIVVIFAAAYLLFFRRSKYARPGGLAVRANSLL